MSRATRVVPWGQPASVTDSTSEAAIFTRVPVSAPAGLVSISTRATAAMEARASPRKPRVAIWSRSPASRTLLVAWRRKAVAASSGAMPQPLSVTRR